MLSIYRKDSDLCLRCHHYKKEYVEGYWTTHYFGYRTYIQPKIAYLCRFLNRYIHNIKQTCKHFLDMRNIRLTIGGEGMVNIESIPNEGETIQLKDLPQEAVLKAIDESYREREEKSSAGLIITFKMKDERTFPQKYTAMSGAILKRAMKKLKLKDTEELQDNWYKYKLTPMRMGRPRMIPVEKVA